MNIRVALFVREPVFDEFELLTHYARKEYAVSLPYIPQQGTLFRFNNRLYKVMTIVTDMVDEAFSRVEIHVELSSPQFISMKPMDMRSAYPDALTVNKEYGKE